MLKLKRLIMLTLATLALAACASQATPDATETLPTDEAEAETVVPTSTPRPRLTPIVDNCLDCHTDKEALMALATESEDAHGSESEGVG